jgi:hypothetical protein
MAPQVLSSAAASLRSEAAQQAAEVPLPTSTTAQPAAQVPESIAALTPAQRRKQRTLALAGVKELQDAYDIARAQASNSQKAWNDDSLAVTLDKINKAIMLGQQVLSYAETHAISDYFPLVPQQVADLQVAASTYRDAVKGRGKGRR